MRGYDRDEYEDLDDYEEEGEEQEDEGVDGEEYEECEEEAPQPTQEELEYLELRQRLKESIRKQMKKKESSSAYAYAQDRKKKLPYDNYGSFFGPSQPVIAQRVIQESKSLLENQHLAAKVSKSHHHKNKSHATSTMGSKNQVHDHRPKAINQLKMKVQKLKDTRDYSFLLSDDTDLPAPNKDPTPRKVSVSSSEVRPAQIPPKSKPSLTNTRKQVPNGREERKPMSSGSQMHPKAGIQKSTLASKPLPSSIDSRRHLGNNNGSGPGRPVAPKILPPKTPSATTERKLPTAVAKSSLPSSTRPPSSKSQSSAPKQPSVFKRPLEHKREFQESSQGKVLPKQQVPSSRQQVIKAPAKVHSRPVLQEERPKKKPVRRYSDDEDDDDDGRAISMIRRMFGYNPNRYAGRDYDDDSDMEANFDDIMREEKRSSRIARKEDEEELRKIEEEERRERMRKEAKKRKLSQR